MTTNRIRRPEELDPRNSDEAPIERAVSRQAARRERALAEYEREHYELSRVMRGAYEAGVPLLRISKLSGIARKNARRIVNKEES